MSERSRHKLPQRQGAKRKPRRQTGQVRRDQPLEGLRNKEVCEALGMHSGNVAKAATEGKLRRHADGSYTRESVVEYAQRFQGRPDFELPDDTALPEPLMGELVPTNSHALMSTDELKLLDVQYMRARVKNEENAALLREMAYLREIGSVIDRAEMEHTVQAAFARVREGLLNLAARLTPELTGLDDEAEVYRRIDGEARRMIRGLQQAVREIE